MAGLITLFNPLQMKPMANKGREFEKLVATIERSLDKTGAIIETRARIPDIDSGQSREVDIAIRINTGSSKILIIVECRDRNRNDDVTWIEQLIAKRRSVGADKVVAVSGKGLTNGAIEKANNNNIEIRTLKKLKPKDIRKWIGFPTFRVSSITYEYLGGTISAYHNKSENLSNVKIEWFDSDNYPSRNFTNIVKNEKLSIIHLFHLICDEQAKKFSADEKGYFDEVIRVERYFDIEALGITTSVGERFVRHIDMTFHVSGHSSDLKISTALDYSNNSSSLAKLIKFSGKIDVQGKMEDVELTATLKGND